jgi:hypothetical protein
LSERCALAEDDAYELLAYLITSAEIGLIEPAFYGPRRLLDAAARLAGAMAARVGEEPESWLSDFSGRASEAMALARRRPEEFEAFLHEAAGEIAAALKRRSAAADDAVS